MEAKVIHRIKSGYTNNSFIFVGYRYIDSILQFIPRNKYEEIILVLIVAEAIAVRNAVLSQSPDFKDARHSAYQDAAAVYDLLTLATVRWGQVALLQEVCVLYLYNLT